MKASSDPSRAPAPRPADTPERILDAAERLFVEHGYETTSVRLVTLAAGVNIAAISYHFGSKEGLIRAVLRRRLEALNRERLRALDEAEARAGGGAVRPSQIVEGFFGTIFRLAADPQSGGPMLLRLLGRIHAEPAAFIHTLLAEEYREVLERYKAALFRALPDVPRDEIVWRLHFMLGATAYAVAGTDALRLVTDWGTREEAPPHPEARLLPRLMSFLLGGLRAPLPQFGDVPPAPPA
ncbi:TetR/AcrR family transcriptional regulator [Caldimonas tepidiphila]|uniref:TetR/AcrR family transcriptional regulator n=1 Tax=Caldimonas tepidiphila TaxID=2315841 RepID=UPI000E5C3FD1|nr:TetR/AcrR family transcriptional regulator [Caldimonas tepidiphila]